VPGPTDKKVDVMAARRLSSCLDSSANNKIGAPVCQVQKTRKWKQWPPGGSQEASRWAVIVYVGMNAYIRPRLDREFR